MSSETIDQRLTEDARVEFKSESADSHLRGQITDTDGSRLKVAYGDRSEWIDQEQITSLVERPRSEDRLTREDVPEKPGYEMEIDENVDDALEDALKTASIANERYLEALLSAELGSFRLERGVYDDG